MASGKDTGYQATVAGNYEVFLTVPNTTNVYLSTGPINLTASANQTVVVLDAVSGGTSYELLTDQ